MTLKFGFGPDWPVVSYANSANAYGARVFESDVLTRVLVRGTGMYGDDIVYRELELFGFGSLVVDSYDVGLGELSAAATGQSLGLREEATAGSVDITRFDEAGIAGSFNLTLTTTGILVGDFDVSFAFDRIEIP